MLPSASPAGARLPEEQRAIRILANALIGLVLAVSVFVAGYSALLAWRRPPPAAATPVDVSLPKEPPPPARLPPARSPKRVAEAAFGEPRIPLRRAPGDLTVRLVGGGRIEGTTLSVVDGESGATLATARVAGTALPAAVDLRVPAGTHWVTAAASPARARIRYVARAKVEVAPGRRTRVELEVRTYWVEVVVRDLAAAQGRQPAPVVPVLRRADDPRWRLTLAVLRFRGGQARFVLPRLGRGVYDLELDGFTPTEAARQRLRFEVPEVSELVIEGRSRSR